MRTNEEYPGEELPSCEGTGVVSLECSGKHRWVCGMGNPDCDDTEIDCPGCSDCEEET